MKTLFRYSSPKVLLLLAGLAVAAQLPIGCATSGGGSADNIARIAPLVRVAAQTGESYYLIEMQKQGDAAVADARDQFGKVVDALDVILASPQITLSSFREILFALPIKQLKDPRAQLLIGTSLTLIDIYAAGGTTVIDLQRVDQLRPIVLATRNGLAVPLGRIPIQ